MWDKAEEKKVGGIYNDGPGKEKRYDGEVVKR